MEPRLAGCFARTTPCAAHGRLAACLTAAHLLAPLLLQLCICASQLRGPTRPWAGSGGMLRRLAAMHVSYPAGLPGNAPLLHCCLAETAVARDGLMISAQRECMCYCLAAPGHAHLRLLFPCPPQCRFRCGQVLHPFICTTSYTVHAAVCIPKLRCFVLLLSTVGLVSLILYVVPCSKWVLGGGQLGQERLPVERAVQGNRAQAQGHGLPKRPMLAPCWCSAAAGGKNKMPAARLPAASAAAHAACRCVLCQNPVHRRRKIAHGGRRGRAARRRLVAWPELAGLDHQPSQACPLSSAHIVARIISCGQHRGGGGGGEGPGRGGRALAALTPCNSQRARLPAPHSALLQRPNQGPPTCPHPPQLPPLGACPTSDSAKGLPKQVQSPLASQ